MLPLNEFLQHKLPKENILKIPFMTEHFVSKFIFNLDNNKATGIDNISIKILKLSSPLIAKHISNICNNSLKYWNIEKTRAMLIMSTSKEARLLESDGVSHITVNGTKIENTKQEKLFGIIIDKNLSSQQQVKKVKQSFILKLSSLRKNRKNLLTDLSAYSITIADTTT